MTTKFSNNIRYTRYRQSNLSKVKIKGSAGNKISMDNLANEDTNPAKQNGIDNSRSSIDIPQQEPIHSNLKNRLKQWWIFGVCITILPLIVTYLGQIFFVQGYSLIRVIGHGQLLLVCVAIASGALGDLLVNDRADLSSKISGGGGCAVVIFISTALFGMTSITDFNRGVQHSPLAMTLFSVAIFGLTVVSSRGCIMASEASE